MFSNVGFHAHFCFQRLAFLFPYVMLTESRSAVNYEFFWVVCMGVLLCSSLLFLLQTCILVFSLQEVLQPHESNNKKKNFTQRNSSSVGKQTMPHEKCFLMNSEPQWGSAQSHWCRVKIHSKIWSGSLPTTDFRHEPSQHFVCVILQGYCFKKKSSIMLFIKKMEDMISSSVLW